MKPFDYQDFYERVGKENGWDFSQIRVKSNGVGWNFYEEVRKKAQGDSVLLDIGTGGGENIIHIASSFLFVVGIDLANGMIQTARANIQKSNVHNVNCFEMDAAQLQFPDEFFDVVSCCHAPFSAKEVRRVLKKGGVFLTQQVSEADKWNLKETFGRGQAFGEEDGQLKIGYIKELEDAGFSSIQSFDYNAVEYYERVEDVIFLLKHTPIIPNFGRVRGDFDQFNQFVRNNQAEKGIKTNAKRFKIVAQR